MRRGVGVDKVLWGRFARSCRKNHQWPEVRWCVCTQTIAGSVLITTVILIISFLVAYLCKYNWDRRVRLDT